MKIQLSGFQDTREVYLDGELLIPARGQQIVNHSPDGFNWGYGGSGPAQLAFAICLELIGRRANYQKFKRDHIATLPKGDFDVTIEFDENDYK